jgi:murein DD-endopeptidase MepM/ murein hydrolase activator NlpD
MLTRRLTRRVIGFLLFVKITAIYGISFAQEIPQSGYPHGYFRDPLDLPIHLAGNFGELRPGHFHMGLDMKTNGRIGYPVYAAADGYISHVKIESAGFGNAIYISHPNGYTTVYVHLNNFGPELARYVKEQQYKLQRWEVLLDIPPGLFPVKQGQFIANSGNTGGSYAPHLHFEIRDTKTDQNRNPFLFGLPIEDHEPPSLYRVAVYDGDRSTYLQVPKVVSLIKTSEGYTVLGGKVTIPFDKVRLAIGAEDHQTGSANALGIDGASLAFDGAPVCGFALDKFGYDLTRYVDAHVDYSLKTGGGPYVQYLSPLPGNRLPIYNCTSEDGMINLTDDSVHNVAIQVKDAAGNVSEARFMLQKAGLPPVYGGGDLFVPNQVNVFENDEFLLYLPEDCLYDAVRPFFTKKDLPGAGSPEYSLISALIPSLDSFTVSIKPGFDIVPEDADHYVIVEKGAGKQHVASAEWNKGWAVVKLRDFGDFQLVLDKEPPVIIPLGWRDGSRFTGKPELRVALKDNLEAIRGFRAELDGKWLMFSHSGNIYTYRFDEHFPPGRHTLVLSVEDEAGNRTEKSFSVSR